jgi:hypothetical protein
VIRIPMLAGLQRTFLTLYLVLFLTQPFEAAGARTRPLRATLNRDYTSALAAADRFLHAWQTRDAEAGLLLLTDRARQHTDESKLHDFFSAERNASSSFEIGRGRKLSGSRYEFPVTLFPVDATRAHRGSRRASSLIVVRVGQNDWGIDKLP